MSANVPLPSRGLFAVPGRQWPMLSPPLSGPISADMGCLDQYRPTLASLADGRHLPILADIDRHWHMGRHRPISPDIGRRRATLPDLRIPVCGPNPPPCGPLAVFGRQWLMPPPVDYWLSLADNGRYCAPPSPCGHCLKGPIQLAHIGTDSGRCGNPGEIDPAEAHGYRYRPM